MLYACLALAGLSILIFYRDHWLSSEYRALRAEVDVLTRRLDVESKRTDLLTRALRNRRDRSAEETKKMSPAELAKYKRSPEEP